MRGRHELFLRGVPAFLRNTARVLVPPKRPAANRGEVFGESGGMVIIFVKVFTAKTTILKPLRNAPLIPFSKTQHISMIL